MNLKTKKTAYNQTQVTMAEARVEQDQVINLIAEDLIEEDQPPEEVVLVQNIQVNEEIKQAQ